jgi:hypothetical protein
LNHLNQTFLKPLRKSIDLARAHFKLEIKNQKGNNKQKEQQQQSTDTEIIVDNVPLPALSKQEQLETLHTAITKFDILECILGSLSDTFGGEL